MNPVVDFLKVKVCDMGERAVCATQKGKGRLNELFSTGQCFGGFESRHPLGIQKYQIWTVKQHYIDYQGCMCNSNHPLTVILSSGEESFEEGVSFVRACVVSPFVEMADQGDLVCSDASVLGYPFFIESWNEQPFLTELLDQYLGIYDISAKNQSDGLVESFSIEQQEFRKVEVLNAGFLRQSVWAYLNEVNRESDCLFSVDFMSSDYVRNLSLPRKRLKCGSRGSSEMLYSGMAAKIGSIDADKDYIEIDEPQVAPFRIQVRKKEDGYVLSLFSKTEMRVLDCHGTILHYDRNGERVVYSSLPKGLYSITNLSNHEVLTIRIK